MSEATVSDAPAKETETAYAEAKVRVRGGASANEEAMRLVSQMTVEEKLGCLDGDQDFWPGLLDMVSGGYYRHPFAAAAVPRLGFPGLRFCDGPRGVVIGASTCFPVAMARGATFDPELEERVGDAIGIEARIQGADFFAGVCVNLLRHPGWGRAQETYGEDPHHVGEMGAALTRGVQRHVMACVKHFACNSIENSRFQVDVCVGDQALHEVYLPHFRRVVDEGVASVMSAYNSLNGQWCGDNHGLLSDILRGLWGFEGFVVSDFVYGLRDPVASVKAGLDIEMPFRQQRDQTLRAAVADGSLRIEVVDACVLRIVRTILRFDANTSDTVPVEGLLAGDSHRFLARQAAADSIVLLRNEPRDDGTRVLPILKASVRRIAVLGRLADVPNLGDGGSSNVHPPSVVTPMAGLKAALPGVEWTTDASVADLAIVVVGYTCEDEGEYTFAVSPELFALMPPMPDDDTLLRLAEAQSQKLGMATGGDRRSLRLRPEDEELIARTTAQQPQTVVLMMGGSAIVVEPWIEATAAVLHVWYPGMEGGHAIADVLTGAVNPCGRLPFAVPVDADHLTAFDPDASTACYDEWHGQWKLDRDGHEARYPFGFGLSYSRFVLTSAQREGGDVLVDLANEGDRDGAVVIFVFDPHGGREKLLAFRKVHLAAGGRAILRLCVGEVGRVRVALHAHDPHAIDLDAERSEQG